MTDTTRVAVAGAGIAGLAGALALSARGFDVTVFERSNALEEVGAGLQLSPNATRILSRLGVLPSIEKLAVEPEAVQLTRATDLRPVASVPLGPAARERWGAPYLTIHRADLQAALLSAVQGKSDIALRTGAKAMGIRSENGRTVIAIDRNGDVSEEEFALVVAADGVWSTLRGSVSGTEKSRYSGYVAWRAVLPAQGSAAELLPPLDRVTTFLHPRFHLVAYPLRRGEAVNLVALSKAPAIAERWSTTADTTLLLKAMQGADRRLADLVNAASPWTVWPLHEVPADGRWIDPAGMVLVGDAAHALTPFAAQGAAMAIEDAATLAIALDNPSTSLTDRLARYEALRRGRVRRVARRGAFNRFAWHASGPVALARNAVLALRSGPSLAADLDWLYGWDPETASRA